MSTAGSRNWHLNLESNWQAEDSDECMTLFRPDGAGALQISAAIKDDGEVSEEELNEFIADCLGTGEFPRVRLGAFLGRCTEYVAEETYWLKWCVSTGRLVLFVTYTCGFRDKDQERSDVGAMLSTLEAGAS